IVLLIDGSPSIPTASLDAGGIQWIKAQFDFRKILSPVIVAVERECARAPSGGCGRLEKRAVVWRRPLRNEVHKGVPIHRRVLIVVWNPVVVGVGDDVWEGCRIADCSASTTSQLGPIREPIIVGIAVRRARAMIRILKL